MKDYAKPGYTPKYPTECVMDPYVIPICSIFRYFKQKEMKPNEETPLDEYFNDGRTIKEVLKDVRTTGRKRNWMQNKYYFNW